MARRIVAFILGLTVLGALLLLLDVSKEAGIEVTREESSAEQPASLPVRVVASGDGDITVDGRPVDAAELADEVSRLIAAADDASLPEPAFVIAVPRESDNMLLVTILESLKQGGATSVAIDTHPSD